MAEAPAAPETSFEIRWSMDESLDWQPRERPAAVAWRPEGELGVLAGNGGRVLLTPGASESHLQIHPDVAHRTDHLEPLLEAALGHAMAARGECFLHGAALELRGRRLLVLGASGSGKSTLAAAVAASGGRIVSDDCLILGRVDAQPVARAARRNVWLRPTSAALVPALAGRRLRTIAAPDGRLCLDRELSAEAFLLSIEPDVLVVLEPGAAFRTETAAHSSSAVTTRRLTQAESLAALLRETSALYVTEARFERRRRRLLLLLTLLAERLPAVEVRLDSRLLSEPEESLAALLEALP